MRHCLVVDDSQVVRKVARRIFEELEFETSEAEDTEQALRACSGSLPDVILVDSDIPSLGGIDFMRALHRIKGGFRPAVFFLMAENDVAQITEAVEKGARDFLMKPFDRETVEAKLTAAGLGIAEDEVSAVEDTTSATEDEAGAAEDVAEA